MENNTVKDKESLSRKVDIYQDEILKRNYRNFKSFAFGGMILTGLIALIAIIFLGYVYFTREYCICFIHFVLCNLYIYFFLKKHKKYTLCSFYIALIPIFIIGILMGTFLDPTSNAMTVMIMFCTLCMFITDKPQHVVSYILGSAAVFLCCSYSCKSLDLFVGDVVNLAIYLSIGLSVNMLTLKDRLESAENYILAMRRADNDTLTSILNRGGGDNLVKKMLKDGQKGAFLIIDIDNFKRINDSYGHQVGDEVIQATSQQLKTVFRDIDVVWRLGGDEFAVFAVDLVSKEVCENLLRKLQDGLSNTQTSYSKPLGIKISIGCSICKDKGYKFDDIYKSSDDALYEAKHQGKNGYVILENGIARQTNE